MFEFPVDEAAFSAANAFVSSVLSVVYLSINQSSVTGLGIITKGCFNFIQLVNLSVFLSIIVSLISFNLASAALISLAFVIA